MPYIVGQSVLAYGYLWKAILHILFHETEHMIRLGGRIRKEVRRNNSKNEDDGFMFAKTPKGQNVSFLLFQQLNIKKVFPYILKGALA